MAIQNGTAQKKKGRCQFGTALLFYCDCLLAFGRYLVDGVDASAIGLFCVQLDEDPARGAVDGNEQVAPCRFTGICGRYLMSMCTKPGS